MAANGERLTDDQTVFRAFADKSHRDRKRQKVRAGAYLLRQIDADDGLSVGTTPEAAVMYLEQRGREFHSHRADHEREMSNLVGQ